MKVEVEVISSCMVKPSSPTPDHLQKYTLSFLDQVNPPVFMPLVLFYPAEKNLTNTERSKQLKKSLSLALTRFHLLAGRLVGNSFINCNDEGVPYVEARVMNCKLSEVLDDPIPGEMNKFLPYELGDVKDLILVIQINFFDCGGMVVGIEISHKVADALSLFQFLTNWASISRANNTNIPLPLPKFDASVLFPPKDMAGFQPTTGIMKKDDIITKRFVFTSSKITALREKYKSGENSKPPTRIEALSAFIWTRFMTAIRAKDDPDRIYSLTHAVNLRTRAQPPLREYYFGNLSRPAIAIPNLHKIDDDEDEGGDIVKKMRDAIHNLGGDYVAKIREGDKHLNFLKDRANKVTKGEMVSFSFTSLCRFPLYEADFGWGKPVWVASASFNFKNLVCFLDTQSGDGIEAWVNLKKEDMAKFETDEEFLSFVSSTSDAKSSIF